VDFELLEPIRDIETFAIGSAIRELPRLRKKFGKGRWRKRKGFALIKLRDGTIGTAEIHWYEADGIGKRDMRIKRILD
jgi:hypothetical protein